jgi:hypothetical protein
MLSQINSVYIKYGEEFEPLVDWGGCLNFGALFMKNILFGQKKDKIMQ